MQTVKIKRVPTLNFRAGKVKIMSGQNEIAILNEYETEVKINVMEDDEVWAKIQFCSSNKIRIKKSTKEVYLTSFLKDRDFIIILGSTLICALIALLTRYTFFGLFPIIILLYPIYYITFGKSNYLKLTIRNVS